MELLVLFFPFVLLYVLLIRPQQRRLREAQLMSASLEPEDDVITAGGIHGTVTAVDDETVWLEIAPDVIVRVLKGAISQRVGPPRQYDDADADADDDDDEEEVEEVDEDEVDEDDEPTSDDRP